MDVEYFPSINVFFVKIPAARRRAAQPPRVHQGLSHSMFPGELCSVHLMFQPTRDPVPAGTADAGRMTVPTKTIMSAGIKCVHGLESTDSVHP